MEDLNKDEINQLLVYYKNRAAELEFQLLQSQVKLNRTVDDSPVPAKKTTVEK